MAMKQQPLLDLQALPEGCIAHVISLTSPPDACRLSLLSRVVRSAADSDANIWDKFIPHHTPSPNPFPSLPPTLPEIKEGALHGSLRDPVLIEDGNMSFSLDKWSGKKLYMIAAKRLRIACDNTVPYWRRKSLTHNESRFKDASELYGTVCWFEIPGRIETRILSPLTTYKAFLVYKSTEDRCVDSHCWPIKVTVGARAYGFNYECPGLKEITAGIRPSAFLAPRGDREDWSRVFRTVQVIRAKIKKPKFPNEGRADGWLEIELGEFHCKGDEDGELEMICCNMESGMTSLLVQGIEVRPKS